MLHLLDIEHPRRDAPNLVSFPYHYQPHRWLILARDEVLHYLKSHHSLHNQGHLIALVLVRNRRGRIGYLCGLDQARCPDEFFIPSFFEKLPQIEPVQIRSDYIERATQARIEAAQAYESFKAQAHERRARRHEARQQSQEPQLLAQLAKESQNDSRALSEYKSHYEHALEQESRAHGRFQAESFNAEKNQWRTKLRSISISNFAGQSTSLDQLFENELEQEAQLKAALRTSLPALLAYASEHRLKVLDWGCFWYGASPEHDVRFEGSFYAFPKERHQTLLKFLSQGLKIAPNALAQEHFADWVPEILYEDEDLVAVNKPAGMLSVPGKAPISNVYDIMKARYPQAQGTMLLHRLDMSTSGVLVFAKTKQAHYRLQQDFARQQVAKCYIALLEKAPEEKTGTIELPMCLNPYERPRQMIDSIYGRHAITEYSVLGQTDAFTRVAFYPVTGRSHQLRLHAAHHLGLNAPIVGDELYGHPADRLYLHALAISFKHPITDEIVTIEAPCPF